MRARRQSGYTMVELLVTVAIVGVLASIAIPHYAEHRRSAVDAKVQVSLHDAATAMESYHYGNDGRGYQRASIDRLGDHGFNPSSGVRYWVIATPHRYLVLGQGEGGTDVFWVGSEGGGIGRPRGNRP